MTAAAHFASCSAIATRSGVITPSVVILAKAGIHAAGFADAGKVTTSTSDASAEWTPAFAGMTAWGDDAQCTRLDVRHTIVRRNHSRAR